MFWSWQNDPEGLPDDDHARCITATGVRKLRYRGRAFEMTTVACVRQAASSRGPGTDSAGLDLLETVATELAAA